ncbi:ATP-dependent DNA helicase pif1-like [Octopus sinensis]|uniref:ATP-dependent DNA helicase pif1-like n=1 Tax=Octopus sinensis TaxID=2607531 RepID=A0A7E6EIN2_9MOLL|nr:ATP-dependent DNA helicase pif1-like [Octopus sinensis]
MRACLHEDPLSENFARDILLFGNGEVPEDGNEDVDISSPVMLIRNLNPSRLCNGTRLVIIKLFPNVIEAMIMTVCDKGQDIFILRISLVPLAADLSFTFRREQFPIRLSYVMSINKSQGQSLSVVGLYLAEPYFSHGQLYAGYSRVSCRNSLHAFISQGKTKNVVYKPVQAPYFSPTLLLL